MRGQKSYVRGLITGLVTPQCLDTQFKIAYLLTMLSGPAFGSSHIQGLADT